jgi:hypothetical protein
LKIKEKLAFSREDNLILSILNQEDGVIIDPYGIEIEKFLDKAREEGLSALLFKNLKENGLLHRFPVTIQNSLRESYLLTLSRNMILMKDIERVLSSLEDKGVRTIVLKGPALLERVYPDIGVRPITDIDLLFYNGNEEAGRILKGLGYRLISTCPMIYDNGRTVIDIHTEIDSFTRLGPIPYAPQLDTTKLWKDSSPWGDGFNSVRILSPEDAILTLSIHLMKHSFLRLLWLIDIIEVIKRNPEIDWNKIGDEARETGFERLLFYVLSYVKEITDIVPGKFLSEIRPEKLGLVEQGILDRILKNRRKEGYGDILYFYTIKGTFRKFLFAMRVLFPERKKVIEISGSRYPYLYYPKRVFELFIVGVRFLWNYISGNRQSAICSLDGERL